MILYICTRTRGWFSRPGRSLCNKPQVLLIKNSHLCLQISHQTSQTAYNRRPMGFDCPNLLSFGSRSVLDHFSLVPRSSLVRYSLVYRRPNEDRTRNKQKTNERATNVGRETNEKLSKTRRETAQPDGKGSFLVSNVKPNELNWITFVLTGRGWICYMMSTGCYPGLRRCCPIRGVSNQTNKSMC